MSSHFLHDKHTFEANGCDFQSYYIGDNIPFSLEFHALDADGCNVQTQSQVGRTNN